MDCSRSDPLVFRIVLRDSKGYDPFLAREFDLPLDSTSYPIGRASNSNLKKKLAPASTNAFIDSPVVSRQHAVLFANATSGTPQVYISDCKSMHGTMVNGLALEPNKPHLLKTGDELQFGVDVHRNEGECRDANRTLDDDETHSVTSEYFVARTYTFQAQHVPAYSLGFTVPDADSEDEEIPAVGHDGSETNPVMLDDSDAASNHTNQYNPETTLISANFVSKDQTPITIENDSELPPPITVVQDSYAEEEGEDILVHSSDMDVNEEHDMDLGSDDSSVGSSERELDYPSEPEVADSEEEEADMDSYPALGYDYEKGKLHLEETIPITDVRSKNGMPQLPSFDVVFSQGANDIAFTDATPQPPNQLPLQHSVTWSSSDTQTIFVPISDHDVTRSMPWITEYGHLQSAPDSAQFPTYRLQTPPLMPNMDVINSPDLQPARRTKVSIEEIVEEQPLTPSSVNDLKRKADIFDEEVAPAFDSNTTEDADVPSAESPMIDSTSTTAQAPAVIAQRPKKQPRSLLSRLGQTAKYPLLGAAGAVAAFTFLAAAPDSFFMP